MIVWYVHKNVLTTDIGFFFIQINIYKKEIEGIQEEAQEQDI